MKTKKLICLFLATVMVISVTACEKSGTETDPSTIITSIIPVVATWRTRWARRAVSPTAVIKIIRHGNLLSFFQDK